MPVFWKAGSRPRLNVIKVNALRNHPGFHVWIFNHQIFYGVGDQLHFLFKYFKQHGFKISCGRQPRTDRCNIVIENFDFKAVQLVRKFCDYYGKSISIVLTEHVDIVGKIHLPISDNECLFANSVYLHGKPVNADFSYLPLPTMLQRINCLLSLRECTHIYMRLGDLPEMHGFEHLVHNRGVETLWFPALDDKYTHLENEQVYDFIFIGAITPFRKFVIDRLKNSGFTFVPMDGGVSVKHRHKLYKKAKFCLNIPQDETWKWLSTMRIVSALQAGLPTLSVWTNDKSAISSCIIQIPSITDDLETIRITELLRNFEQESVNAINSYRSLVSSLGICKANCVRELDHWALTDGLY